MIVHEIQGQLDDIRRSRPAGFLSLADFEELRKVASRSGHLTNIDSGMSLLMTASSTVPIIADA